MHLQGCIDYLKSEEGFKEGWYDSYDFSDNDKIDESTKDIIRKIDVVAKKVYEYLNFSIISGEFIENINYKTKLDEIKNIVSEILSSVDSNVDISDEESVEQKEDANNNTLVEFDFFTEFLHKFSNPISNSLKDISTLCHRYSRTTSLDSSKEILFDAISRAQVSDKNFIHNDSKFLYNILLHNINLTFIDRNLFLSKELLRELLFARQSLIKIKQENGEFNYLSIVYDKCNYLIRKIVYRYKQNSKTDYLYAFDHQDKKLNLEELNPGLFSDFDAISKKHYPISNDDYEAEETIKIQDKLRKNFGLNFLDYHHLVKIYKDKNKDYTQVKNLIKQFRTGYKIAISSDLTEFDLQAHHVMLNYMLNNKFSIFLKSNVDNIKKAEDLFSEIERVQSETRIKNYFPYISFCDYLVLKIEQLFLESEINYDEVLRLSEKLRIVLKKAYENFEWSKDHKFIAFQLVKNECCLKNAELDLNIFLSSSFALPIDYDRVEDRLKELTRLQTKYLTLYEVHLNLKTEKDIIIHLKDEFKNTERKSIEVLGIFSAIVLFTSGSIQIFGIEGITFKDALTFMLTFSYSLILFIFLIWLITRENIKSLTSVHKIFFICLIILAGISMWHVWDNDKSSENNKKQTQKNQDGKLKSDYLKESLDSKQKVEFKKATD